MTADRTREAATARVRKELLKRRVPASDIDAAVESGRVGLLAVDTAVIGGEPRYTRVELARRAGVPAELLERLWLALGFPPPDDEATAFTDADLAAVTTLRRLLEQGLAEPEMAVQFARVLGSAMSRLAEALVSAQPGLQPTSDGQLEYAEAVLAGRGAVLDGTAKLIEYTWRRHLQAAARRGLFSDQAVGGLGALQAVGFADLVGYTALSQQLSEHALAAVVGRLEELAYDIVAAAGGRVVKTIGDEVMFVVGDPLTAVRIGLSLAEAYADDDLLSEVRVGVASGPVLARDGDYFGPVVNLASRLVGVAYPGTVLVSADTHDALAAEPDLAWRQIRPRRLKDIGTVPLWAVYRAGDKAPPGASRRRFGPLRALLEEAHLQRAERRATAEPSVADAAVASAADPVTARRGAPSRSAKDPEQPSR